MANYHSILIVHVIICEKNHVATALIGMGSRSANKIPNAHICIRFQLSTYHICIRLHMVQYPDTCYLYPIPHYICIQCLFFSKLNIKFSNSNIF